MISNDSDPSESHGLRKRTLRGIAWVAAEKWGIRLMSLLVFVILLRTIDSEAFGLVSFATAVAALLQVVVDGGFAKALVQKKRLDAGDADTAFWASIAIAVVLYAGVFVTAPMMESMASLSGLSPILRVMALGLFFSTLSSVPAALLERDLRFKALGVRNLLGTIVGAAISVPLALMGFGPWALVAQTLGTIVASTIALWLVSRWRPRLKFSFDSLRNITAFGLSSMGIALTNALQANLDKILVNTLLGAQAGGIYFVAQRGIQLITELITSVIGKVALTTFSRMQDDRERLNRGFLELTFAACLVAFPVFAVVGALADILLPFIAGDNAEWGQAIPLMQIFAVSSAFTAVAYFDKQTLLAVGHPRKAFFLGLIENLLGIVLFIIAAPFGLIALAFARASRLFLMWPWRLWLLRAYAGIRLVPYVRNVGITALSAIIPVVLAIVLGFTSWRDAEPVLWVYGVPVAGIMLVLYAGCLWVICGRANRALIRNTFAILR